MAVLENSSLKKAQELGSTIDPATGVRCYTIPNTVPNIVVEGFG